MTVRSITLVIKPTLKCNARCIYCHSIRPSASLTLSTLSDLFQKTAAFTKTHNIRNVTILWHGGEPMVMGADFYASVIDLEKKYLDHLELHNTMQSNLCLYKGRMREVMLELLNGGEIGTCLDPYHPTRSLVNGQDYFKEALTSIYELNKDSFRVTMIYVVHKKSLEVVRNLYYFFRNLGQGGIIFHPVENSPDTEYSLSSQEWGEFLKRLWDVWEEDDYQFPISPLLEWRQFITGCQPITLCEYGIKDRSNLFLTISPEGLLYPCPRFQDKSSHCIGNISDKTFDEIISHQGAHLITDTKENHCSECVLCEYIELCRSGCVATHDETGRTMWCIGLKEALTYITSKCRGSIGQ